MLSRCAGTQSSVVCFHAGLVPAAAGLHPVWPRAGHHRPAEPRSGQAGHSCRGEGQPRLADL
eukprot:scaffold266552_cov43-Prasinocladus_malaysianus.AAC.2